MDDPIRVQADEVRAAAARIVGVLRALDEEQREVLADALAADDEPFMVAVGRACRCGLMVGGLLVVQVLDDVTRHGRALKLADELGVGEPWETIAGALRAADAATGPELRFR